MRQIVLLTDKTLLLILSCGSGLLLLKNQEISLELLLLSKISYALIWP
jgi:hypothetical protein